MRAGAGRGLNFVITAVCVVLDGPIQPPPRHKKGFVLSLLTLAVILSARYAPLVPLKTLIILNLSVLNIKEIVFSYYYPNKSSSFIKIVDTSIILNKRNQCTGLSLGYIRLLDNGLSTWIEQQAMKFPIMYGYEFHYTISINMSYNSLLKV